jgi:hypothetical protein
VNKNSKKRRNLYIFTIFKQKYLNYIIMAMNFSGNGGAPLGGNDDDDLYS